MRDSPIIFTAPIDASDTTLEQKKIRLRASIEAKRRSNLANRLETRLGKTIEVSAPTKNLKY